MLVVDLTTPFGEKLVTAGFIIGGIALDRIIGYFKNRKANKRQKLSLESIEEQVQRIMKELSVNGGGSVKDVSIETHKEVLKHSKLIEDLQTRTDLLRAQSRAKLEMQLNLDEDPAFLTNENGEFTYVNSAIQDMFGLTKAEMLKFGWLKAISNPREKEDVREALRYSVEERISFSVNFNIVNQRTKTTYLIEMVADPVWDERGNPLWFFGKAKIKTT